MTQLLKIFLLSAFLFEATSVAALAQEPKATRYYLIGNSLTWDTIPSSLAGDVQWHVDCGKSLPFVYANPDKPCVKNSTLWPKALRDKQYDIISVQPHYGSTLAQDVETISAWMKLQPRAVFVIHSGWARHAQYMDEFAGYAAPTQMAHSPNYIRALIAELRRAHPGQEIRQTLAQNLLAQVAEDIAAQRAPFKKLGDIYRDEIHMTLNHGRYLMHNAMRHALGQRYTVAGFDKTEPAVKKYLDGLLALLDTAPADKALLVKILSADQAMDRGKLIAQLSSKDLQDKMKSLLPQIEQAVKARPTTLALEAEINSAGGKLICTPGAPQWLYLATGDTGMEIFDIPAAVNLYNGNNPLKGKGGRNDKVTDDWLKKLAGAKTLRKIDLANCAIQGDGLQHLGALTGLRELNLTLTPINDDALKHLGGLTELRNLGLASTQCNGTGFQYLKGLKKLDNVNFHYTPLNDAGLSAIAQVPITGRLWFAHTHFTDKGTASLKSLTQLKRVGLGSKDKASSGAAVAALTSLPLEDLSLLDNQATPEGLAQATKIATLRRLDVSYAPTVKDESMPQVAQMPALEEFKLGSAQISDDGLLALAASKSLKKLSLHGLKKVTPLGIEKLRQAQPKWIIEIDGK